MSYSAARAVSSVRFVVLQRFLANGFPFGLQYRNAWGPPAGFPDRNLALGEGIPPGLEPPRDTSAGSYCARSNPVIGQ
jgi:hypothetical protein